MATEPVNAKAALARSSRPAWAIFGERVLEGVIHVSGVLRHGYDHLNERMRRKAREVGADAIIFVHYGTENILSLIPFFVAIPYDVLTADGLAVRSTDGDGAETGEAGS